MDMISGNIELNEVTVEYKDFLEYSKTTNVNFIIKVWRGIGVAYISLFGLVLFISLSFSESGTSKTSNPNLISWDLLSRISGFLFMVFILFIVPWFIYPVFVNKMMKKSFQNNKFIQKPQTYILDDFGFKVISEHGESKLKWEDVTVVKETKCYLALYISKHQAFIIPRRFLENRIDLISFIKKKASGRYSVVKRGLQIS